MKFPPIDHPITGVAVPISALRSDENSGIGEFLDLIKLGQWCQKTGLELVQILPVNDTGFESSPYSALSAFALHPVYLRLSAIPGAEAFADEIAQIRTWHFGKPTVPFYEIVKDKWSVLQKIYKADQDRIRKNPEFQKWIKDNPWVVEYAVFSVHKHLNGLAGWQDWPSFRNPSQKQIRDFFDNEKNAADVYFFVWLQWHAERQFVQAAMELHRMGVSLKGDLPILLNEDSADVWAHPEYFDLSMRAGAPPDSSTPDGQNWGFPTYRWDALAKDGYQWWKSRLLQANKFYHAYRIDHVLGFFRLWGTPQADFTARLGHFEPARTITRTQLKARGFDDGRIAWLSEPHIFGNELRERLGPEADKVIEQALVKIGQEELYKFRHEIKGEKQIAAMAFSEQAKSHLYLWWRNRTLIKLSEDSFLPIFTYYASRSYDSLGQEERWKFDNLIKETVAVSETLWEKQGDALMEFMKNTTPMLVCAEDLGAIPASVPKVLKNRGILGLKIVRWAREWDTPGQPYFPVRRYPELSVCTLSVHDTSTFRQWWDEEKDHRGFFEALGMAEIAGPFSPAVAEKTLEALLKTSALLCVLAVQDLFALQEEWMTDDPAKERINTPGTVSPSNWNYKTKPSLEMLLAENSFNERLSALTKVRRASQVTTR